MAYLHISSGLRGCYMPDTTMVCRFTTRRELRSFVESESRDMIEAYGHGYSRTQRRAIVAQIWREVTGKAPKQFYDHAIGFGRTRTTSDRPFGLFISHATRGDYLDYLKECDPYH